MNWYWLLESCASSRIGGGFCMKARMPGTSASFGRNCWITLSTESFLSLLGFSVTNMKPELEPTREPVAPTVDMNPLMFGLAAILLASSCWCATISSNEAPCAPSVVT